VASPKLEPLVLSDDERRVLQGWSRRRKTARALALRSRIVLACAGGAPVGAVAGDLGVSRTTVAKWRSRFLTARLEGLSDEPRPGRPRAIGDERVERVITATLEQQPPNGDTHWSTRSMARSAGMSQSAVSRIWRAFGLRPHVVQTWKLSADPQFIDKVRDVVGLYMAPPQDALVLCVDEKEFLRFLKLIDSAVPKDLDLHLVLDNYATHKTPEIHKWLLRHPRFHLHFTPASSSWMNLVERWFAELTNRKLRRSAHRSVTDLEADIRRWVNEWNKDPKPFVWTKTADQSSKPWLPTANELTTQDTSYPPTGRGEPR
jgi:transposase